MLLLLFTKNKPRMSRLLANIRHLSSAHHPQTIAIRRETINVFESRAPLAPVHVRRLVRQGIRVIVQPSNRRAFTSREYQKEGAAVQEDISEASLILGVKQVPLDHESLMTNKTYAFFSHTIKAQEANMSLLDTILERKIRLIDYERMIDEKGERMVAFGQYAGIAGMINILHGLGLRFLALGSHTPFMFVGPAHNYRSVAMAQQAIREAGYDISMGALPRSLGPLTFVFTGSGNVSSGAQRMFRELPFEFVEPSQLPLVAEKGALNKLYGCVVRRMDHIKRKSDGKFDADEFQEHPELYRSTFAQTIAPYMSVLVNGIYYAPHAPRLITASDAKQILRTSSLRPWLTSVPGCPSLPHRLVAIADISADPGGSIEFMKECTTIDKPFALYDAETNTQIPRIHGPGVLMCSIDNMPAQLPREATQFFGDLLAPHIPEMMKSDATEPFKDFDASSVVKNAVIASNGVLTPNYQYIAELRKRRFSQTQSLRARGSSAGKKSVLILGAGHVVPPLIDYLHREGDVNITLVSSQKQESISLADKYNSVTPEVVNMVTDLARVDTLVQSHDMVINMLPLKFQETVLNLCLKRQVNLLTAASCTPDIRSRAKTIEDAGITVVMEVGVDPGIDHLLAMQCFDEVRSRGGRVVSYTANIGGLPAPEFSDNPLRYKFNWNAEAALATAVNRATYIDGGTVINIKHGGDAILTAKPTTLLPGFNLEAYTSGDASTYAQLYGLQGCQRLVHGVLRYRGFSDAVIGLIRLGLLSQDVSPMLHPDGPDISWKKFLCKSLGLRDDVFVGTLQDAVFQHLAKDRLRFNCISELGLFSEESIVKRGTPMETLAYHISHRLCYEPQERDVLMMILQIGIQWPDGACEDRHIHLVLYGDAEGFLAVPRSVGVPVAIAAKMVVNQEIHSKGLILPLTKEIYQPILDRLRKEGISACNESHCVVDGNGN